MGRKESNQTNKQNQQKVFDLASINIVTDVGLSCVYMAFAMFFPVHFYFVFDRKFHGSSKNDCLSDIKKGKVEIVVTTFETFREHQVKCGGFCRNAHV